MRSTTATIFSVVLFMTIVACDDGGKKTTNDDNAPTNDDNAQTDDVLTDDIVTDNTVPTDDTTPLNCGNGVTDTGEACDGDAKECAQINSAYVGGWATCKSDCSGYDVSGCTVDPDADIPSGDDTVDDDSSIETDDTATPDDDAATVDIYAPGPHTVLQKDVAENADGNAQAVRIFYPAEAGTYPYINFVHGFQLKNIYYDQILTQLASHGFIIVSPQLKQSLIGGDNSIVEADKILALIADWVKPKLATHTGSAIPDFTRFGLTGHSRGSKISWRMILKTPTEFHAAMGIDPVDTNSTATSDPHAITGPMTYSAPSAAVGTEKGPTGFQACAPADSNSAGIFYPNFPSPAWHLIAGNVGHMDMIDADDLASCGTTCSLCSGGDAAQKATFRTLCGGLLVAFFRASLYGETDLYGKLVDTTGMPHPIVKQENK